MAAGESAVGGQGARVDRRHEQRTRLVVRAGDALEGPATQAGAGFVGQVVSSLEFNLSKAKLETQEKALLDVCNRLVVLESECHCPHVTTLMQEMAQVKIEIVNMNAKSVKTAGVGAGADGGADLHQHADQLLQLLQRVVRLEADMRAAETAWKAMGGDAWRERFTAA